MKGNNDWQGKIEADTIEVNVKIATHGDKNSTLNARTTDIYIIQQKGTI